MLHGIWKLGGLVQPQYSTNVILIKFYNGGDGFMTIIQRLSVLLIIVELFLCTPVAVAMVIRYFVLLNYPLAEVIEPFYDDIIVAMLCLFGHLIVIPAFILSYNCKKKNWSNLSFCVGIVVMFLMCMIALNEYHFAARAEKYYNPETVQSTMVEIDLQQLEDLQDSTEETMIYFGRPSCAHCNEIKPDLDILVNNSHSLVYYYNTEQDREDNHDAMQAVLDTYNVGTVPALAVCDNTSNTQEVYYDEEIVDYFLYTSKFKY